jgi:hypothetical protein
VNVALHVNGSESVACRAHERTYPGAGDFAAGECGELLALAGFGGGTGGRTGERGLQGLGRGRQSRSRSLGKPTRYLAVQREFGHSGVTGTGARDWER